MHREARVGFEASRRRFLPDGMLLQTGGRVQACSRGGPGLALAILACSRGGPGLALAILLSVILSVRFVDAKEPGDRGWALEPLGDASSNEGPLRSTTIDLFIDAALDPAGLLPASPATRTDLARRLHVDLLGLLPLENEVAELVEDPEPEAVEKLVDRLLASPRHGERWARHWMDLVHYAETHGHDEDGIRENAWPYRDYLIRSYNEDTPHARFVSEQIAGDVLFPDDSWSTIATAFLATGPWDQSSQAGIQDGTLDKRIAQLMDRDDMVTTTMSTFASASVHCARCHDHKRDAITLEDYYSLSAVFAGLDRVDRPYDPDPATHRRRRALLAEKARLDRGEVEVNEALLESDEAAFRARLAEWEDALRANRDDWTVLDPERVLSRAGTSFVELEDHSLLFGDPLALTDTYTITAPIAGTISGLRLEVLTHESLPSRGPGRAENGNLHLTSIHVHLERGSTGKSRTSPTALVDESGAPEGSPGTPGAEVPIAEAFADFDQSGWTIAHAIDAQDATAWGIFPRTSESHAAVFRFAEPLRASPGDRLHVHLEQNHGRSHLIGRPRLSVTSGPVTPPRASIPRALEMALEIPAEERAPDATRTVLEAFLRHENETALAALPAPQLVYAVATDFEPRGNYRPARGPRAVEVLRRGNIRDPLEPARPGAIAAVETIEARFALEDASDEGARRAALARWLTHPENPLTWRSIVNRVWSRHFGKGIVSTPNELGGFGAAPSHPALLDRLARAFRDEGGSPKRLHRVLVLSAAYRRSVTHPASERADPENRWLARSSLRRLDAETYRDSLLRFAGELDTRMGGPSDRQFHASKGVHVTPVVDYLGFPPDRAENRRRAVYRFVFRTVPDPLFLALDCPDASQLTPRREESITVAQALALRNHPFLVHTSEAIAARLAATSAERETRVSSLFRLVLGRIPDRDELALVVDYVGRHGLANATRWMLNLDEVLFVR